MPTYDYQCQDCGNRFEAFQKMTDEPLTACPECQGSIQRLITGGTGLIFKGSGFYITDYKNGKKSTSTDGKESKAESKTTESKSTDKTSDNGSSGDGSK